MNFEAYTLSNRPQWACISVKATESEARTPVHLCCVIDTSASMDSDNKLDNVKHSLQYLLDFLGPQDSVSIVTFSDVARTVIKNTFITSAEKENIRTRISIIRAESNTNLSAALIESRESLMPPGTTDVKQGILLLTDGIANMGITRPSDILEIVRSTVTKFNGTTISCVGYGVDHNIQLLQDMSVAGGGSYYVVNNLEDVAVVFGDILGGLVSCVAQQVRVLLPVGTEIKSRYTTLVNGDSMEVLIGDLSAGSEAVFLAKLQVGAAVSMKGYNIQSHSTMVYTMSVITNEDAGLQTNGEAHFLRFEVLELLERGRQLVERREEDAAINTHIQLLNNCISRIEQYRVEHEHTLWDLLISELNSCRSTLENRHRVSHATTQLLSQHSGVLGRMRGIQAQLSQDTVIHSPPMMTPVSRMFSNTTQRNISTQLHNTVTPLGNDPVAIHDDDELADFETMVNQSLSVNPVNPLDNDIAVSQYPPMTSRGALERQIALTRSNSSS